MSRTTYAFARPPRTLVTGGAGGVLGLGVVRRLLELGGSVAAADLPGPLADLAEPDLARVVRVPMDVTDEASVACRRPPGGRAPRWPGQRRELGRDLRLARSPTSPRATGTPSSTST